jgi:hypothetical protein
MLGVDMPGSFPVLEQSLRDFLRVLEDFRKHFLAVCERDEDLYRMDPYYKRFPSGIEYRNAAREFEIRAALLDLLVIELTRAGNAVIDQIRACLSSSFRLAGKLKAVLAGNMNELIIGRFDYDRGNPAYPGVEALRERARSHVDHRDES